MIYIKGWKMKKSLNPNIEWERIEYTLKNGAKIEIIREIVYNNGDAA